MQMPCRKSNSAWQLPDHSSCSDVYCITGAPGRIRTSDPQIRSLVLYPAELRALCCNRRIKLGTGETRSATSQIEGFDALFGIRPRPLSACGSSARPLTAPEADGALHIRVERREPHIGHPKGDSSQKTGCLPRTWHHATARAVIPLHRVRQQARPPVDISVENDRNQQRGAGQ